MNACQNASFKPNIFSGFVRLRQRRCHTGHQEHNTMTPLRGIVCLALLPEAYCRLLLVNVRSDKRSGLMATNRG
jgi:hypothetical protein